ncbi:family 78 glycoside hydrolase catalytic domain [Prevotella sp.]|uniref:family 78 glycoside hydrolase catalytic domain n=1 Tax=Prevotella sp. TaxID=59823 RepID=UPI003DA1EE63
MKNAIKTLFAIVLFMLMPNMTFAQENPSTYNLRINNTSLGSDNTEHLCFSWNINSEKRGFNQKAYQIELSSNEKVIWNSGRINSSESILVPYNGPQLNPATQYTWKVKIWSANGETSEWSQPSSFTTGLFTDKDWAGAKWIALEKDRKDWYVVPGIHSPLVKKHINDKDFGTYILPKFKHSFTATKKISRALAFICGLGQFELCINGNKISDDFLDPGWTKYDKKALYVTFDITKDIKEGNNEIGISLGNGFYNIPRRGYFKWLGSFGAPKVRMLLRLEYEDGKVKDIITDKTWKAAQSAITQSGIYSGENYDATKENMPWQKAIITSYTGLLESQKNPPVKVHEQIAVNRIFKNAKGNWVYDLGQNFSGIIRVKLRGERGKTITFRPAELLNPDSTVNQSATGKYTLSYTLKGGATEEWSPKFSYYGFRYVQLEDAVPQDKTTPDSLPTVEDLVGLHTCSSAPEVGTFNCSNRLFNRTFELIDWAVRSNMQSLLTDCPHREKLGWLEEAHLMQYSMQYRYDLQMLYHKIMGDMEDSQTPNGNIPTIAPEYVHFDSGFEDTPEWGSAFIICPWYVYKWYGDKNLLVRYYGSMKRMLTYLSSREDKDGIVAYGLGDWFDIGPERPGVAQLTSNGVTATAIYYYDTKIMAETALLLNKHDDYTYYHEKAEKIKLAFNKRYLNSDGCYDRNSQTANAMAVYMGLVPEDKKDIVMKHLVADIQSRGNSLTAGDVGYRYVVQTLKDNGYSQVINDMNSRYDVPGYGWQLSHGATALTESWQAYGFVSNNHLMLGHLQEWFFNGIGGISQTDNSIAWKEVCINPQIVSSVNNATTSFITPYGKITCEWKITDKKYTLEINIPANSKAVVHIPTTEADKITDCGVLVSKAETKVIGNETIVNVGSGHYYFECPYSK